MRGLEFSERPNPNSVASPHYPSYGQDAGGRSDADQNGDLCHFQIHDDLLVELLVGEQCPRECLRIRFTQRRTDGDGDRNDILSFLDRADLGIEARPCAAAGRNLIDAPPRRRAG
jgi:hypothetical protein